MYRIQTYTNAGEESLKFAFATEPKITKPYITLVTTQSKITFGDVPFIMYDDLANFSLWGDLQYIREDIIDEAFRQRKRVLIILTLDNEPLLFSTGKVLSVAEINEEFGYTKFLVDGKPVIISKLHFMVISPERDMSI